MSINYDSDLISYSKWIEIPSDINDKSSRPYYFNKETKVTTWVEPPEYTDWYENEIKRFLKSISWRKHFDSKSNKCYYYDKSKRETHWEAPQELEYFEVLLHDVNYSRRKLVENATDFDTVTKTEGAVSFDVVKEEVVCDKVEEDDRHPKKQKVSSEMSECLSLLQCKDGIMNNNVHKTIQTVAHEMHASTPSILEMLSSNYVGYAPLCHVLSRWLHVLHQDPNCKPNVLSLQLKSNDAYTEELILLDQLMVVLKAKNILDIKAFENSIKSECSTNSESNAIPAWLKEALMHYAEYRQYIISLFCSHQDSLLLRECICLLIQSDFHVDVASNLTCGLTDMKMLGLLLKCMLKEMVSLCLDRHAVCDGQITTPGTNQGLTLYSLNSTIRLYTSYICCIVCQTVQSTDFSLQYFNSVIHHTQKGDCDPHTKAYQATVFCCKALCTAIENYLVWNPVNICCNSVEYQLSVEGEDEAFDEEVFLGRREDVVDATSAVNVSVSAYYHQVSTAKRIVSSCTVARDDVAEVELMLGETEDSSWGDSNLWGDSSTQRDESVSSGNGRVEKKIPKSKNFRYRRGRGELAYSTAIGFGSVTDSRSAATQEGPIGTSKSSYPELAVAVCSKCKITPPVAAGVCDPAPGVQDAELATIVLELNQCMVNMLLLCGEALHNDDLGPDYVSVIVSVAISKNPNTNHMKTVGGRCVNQIFSCGLVADMFRGISMLLGMPRGEVEGDEFLGNAKERWTAHFQRNPNPISAARQIAFEQLVALLRHQQLHKLLLHTYIFSDYQPTSVEGRSRSGDLDSHTDRLASLSTEKMAGMLEIILSLKNSDATFFDTKLCNRLRLVKGLCFDVLRLRTAKSSVTPVSATASSVVMSSESLKDTVRSIIEGCSEATVSRLVLVWIRGSVVDSAVHYLGRTSYVTIAPMYLSLVLAIYRLHGDCRVECFQIVKLMLSSKLQQEHQRNTVSNSVATIDPMKIMQIHKHCLLTLVYMLGTCDGDSYNENHLLSPTGDATASVAEFAFEPAMALDMKVMEYIFKYLRVKLPKCDAGVVRFFVLKFLNILEMPFSLFISQEFLTLLSLKNVQSALSSDLFKKDGYSGSSASYSLLLKFLGVCSTMCQSIMLAKADPQGQNENWYNVEVDQSCSREQLAVYWLHCDRLNSMMASLDQLQKNFEIGSVQN